MTRRERIFRDRGEMVRRALIEAKYLSGKETAGDLKAEDLKEMAAGFLVDVIHLAENEKVSFDNRKIFEEILTLAYEAYQADIINSRF